MTPGEQVDNVRKALEAGTMTEKQAIEALFKLGVPLSKVAVIIANWKGRYGNAQGD